MKLGKKLTILSNKKFNRELIYDKKILKAEKQPIQKKAFIVFRNQ